MLAFVGTGTKPYAELKVLEEIVGEPDPRTYPKPCAVIALGTVGLLRIKISFQATAKVSVYLNPPDSKIAASLPIGAIAQTTLSTAASVMDFGLRVRVYIFMSESPN